VGQRIYDAVTEANRLGRGKGVLAQPRLHDDGVHARRDRIAVREPGRPTEVHLAVPGARVDEEAGLAPDRPGHDAGGLGHGEPDRHRAGPADEAGAVNAELTHQQHLAQRDVERTVGLGRDLVGIELALGIDQHHLLERVHRLEDRVHRAVAEPEDLVGTRTLSPRETLAQRRPRE